MGKIDNIHLNPVRQRINKEKCYIFGFSLLTIMSALGIAISLSKTSCKDNILAESRPLVWVTTIGFCLTEIVALIVLAQSMRDYKKAKKEYDNLEKELKEIWGNKNRN